MARRDKPVQAKEKRDFQKTIAFWGLALAAITFVVYAIMNMIKKFVPAMDLDANAVFMLVMNIFSIVSKVCVLLAVALPAYSYVRGRKKAWKIFYWVALAIYACCVVFDIIVVA